MLNNRMSFEKDKNDFEHFASENFYADSFTNQPNKVLQAWDKLTLDITPLQVLAYPIIFHHSLLKTWAESKNA